jgi:phosphoribosylformylglycinamidine synthase subunit PurSL
MTVVPDVKKAVTMDVKAPGDAVVVVGLTRNELGGSEYLGWLKVAGGIVPKIDRALSKPVLTAASAVIQAGLANAAHDCSDGGLAAAVAEMAFAGGFGLDLDLAHLPVEGITALDRALFSESQSRLVVTVPAQHLPAALAKLAGVPHAVIGHVIPEAEVRVRGFGGAFTAGLGALKAAWQAPLQVMEL